MNVEQLSKHAWGEPYYTESWAGLSAAEVVTQSFLAHPDWDADLHRIYLVGEEPFDPAVVAALPVEQWLTQLRGDLELTPARSAFVACPRCSAIVAPAEWACPSCRVDLGDLA